MKGTPSAEVDRQERILRLMDIIHTDHAGRHRKARLSAGPFVGERDSYCWQPFPSEMLVSTPEAAVMVRLKHPPVES